ncbi:hypothetical protein ACVW1B_004457 [Bradyrhizobium sp. USDA 4502]
MRLRACGSGLKRIGRQLGCSHAREKPGRVSTGTWQDVLSIEGGYDQHERRGVFRGPEHRPDRHHRSIGRIGRSAAGRQRAGVRRWQRPSPARRTGREPTAHFPDLRPRASSRRRDRSGSRRRARCRSSGATSSALRGGAAVDSPASAAAARPRARGPRDRLRPALRRAAGPAARLRGRDRPTCSHLAWWAAERRRAPVGCAACNQVAATRGDPAPAGDNRSGRSSCERFA